MARWTRAVAQTFISTYPSVALTLCYALVSSPSYSLISLPIKTLQIHSRAECWVPHKTNSTALLHSLRSSTTSSSMPFKPSFALAGDARRKTGGAEPAVPPRPVPSPKVHPFSHFHIAKPAHISNLSHSSAQPSSQSHPVNLDSHHSKGSSRIVATSVRYRDLHSTTVDNTFNVPSPPAPNSHHHRFASALSQPAGSLPPATLSSRAPRMTSSRFRPPVLASHRLRAWSSPFSIRQRQLLESSLPPLLVDAAYQVVHDAIAPSTKTTYAAGILRFHQFCDSWCINDEAQMPASPILLAAFVGQCSGHYAGGTVRSWLSGIWAWHLTHNAEWHGDHDWVQKASDTSYKEGTAFKCPLRTPVSDDHLLALRQ